MQVLRLNWVYWVRLPVLRLSVLQFEPAVVWALRLRASQLSALRLPVAWLVPPWVPPWAPQWVSPSADCAEYWE